MTKLRFCRYFFIALLGSPKIVKLKTQPLFIECPETENQSPTMLLRSSNDIFETMASSVAPTVASITRLFFS